jgi:TetR/AcrR family transcriptional repressor of nem operon
MARSQPKTVTVARAHAQSSFIAALERRLSDAPPRLKSERTRERIRIAAAKVLSEKGFHSTRVIDITAEAELAEGSFYVYFNDKLEVAHDVLTALLEEHLASYVHADETRDPYEAIFKANARWIAVARSNAGLIRCLLQVGEEVAPLERMTQRKNRDWYGRVARGVVKRLPSMQLLPEDHLIFLAYALGAMMDELLRKHIVYPDLEFGKLLNRLKLDDEGLAAVTSVIWLRLLYPSASPPQKLCAAAATLSRWLTE